LHSGHSGRFNEQNLYCKGNLTTRGSIRNVVYLGWAFTNSILIYEPKCGGRGRGLRGLSQWVQLCTRSPNKLWRSNFIFNKRKQLTALYKLYCIRAREGEQLGCIGYGEVWATPTQ
jgi:hypothetical protein